MTLEEIVIKGLFLIAIIVVIIVSVLFGFKLVKKQSPRNIVKIVVIALVITSISYLIGTSL